MSAQAELMNRATALAEAVKLLRAALHSGVWQRMTDYTDGPGTSRLDGLGATGHGPVADPTAMAALGRNRSMAGSHRTELDQAMAEAATALGRALRLAGLYPARDAHALVVLAKGEPGCESCARTTGPAGTPRYEPIHPKLLHRTDVAGRLDRPLHLCRWCYDRTVLWDRLPVVAELELHHAGRRVPWPADVARPAEASA
jgi:hypothetical protein